MTTSTPPALKLSDLSMRIDIKSFYEAHGAIVSGKPTNSKEGREYAASCPRCGGTDRFSFWDSGRFCCIRGTCGNWHGSSPYYFLRDEGYSHLDALEELSIDPDEIADSYSQNKPPALPLFLISDEPPNKKWQEAAHLFAHMAERCLWSSKGESARAYLQSRGLSDETIKAARLGLCPDWFKQPLEDWGLDASQLMKTDDPQIKIPRGVVIPYYVDGSIHKIQLRRPDGSYFEVIGSSETIYSLAPIEDRPVLLVESEFDALSAHQEASDIIVAVATGGTPKGRNSRNLAALHQASVILQAFDDDPAGHKAAQDWQRLIPGTIRHAPWSHDVNDMLRDDPDSIKPWVELGLDNPIPAEQGEEDLCVDEILALPLQPPALDINGKSILPELVERVRAFQRFPCAGCGGNDWFIDTDNYLTCPCIIVLREEGRLIDLRIAQEEMQKKQVRGW